MSSLTRYHVGALDRDEIAGLDKNTVFIIPTGAIEQHGFLPIATDTMLVEQLSLRLAQRHDGKMLVAPTISIGYSEHHFPFPALSLSPQTFTDTLLQVVGSLTRSGFRNFLILNGHGGNDELIRIAARICVQNWDCRVSAMSYWQPSLFKLYQIRDRYHFKFTIPGHAGACEAALLAALYPSQINLAEIAQKVPEEAASKTPYFDPPYLHYHGSVQTWNGYSDDPRLASLQLGLDFLEAIEEELDDVILKTLLTDQASSSQDYRIAGRQDPD